MSSVLALNCGSSSLKFGVYEAEGTKPTLVAEGEVEELGSSKSTCWYRTAAGEKKCDTTDVADHQSAAKWALRTIESSGVPVPGAVGHRIVHGGPKVQKHAVLTPALIKDLKAAEDFAPLHVPPALRTIEAMTAELPNRVQVACLDTAFHASLPDVSRTFALPTKVTELGVHRYGFHGISIESILPQLDSIPSRLVIAHLGGGCSVTAIQQGKSIDTTMGLTPTGGMMMGTRCGDLDPGVVLYLMRNGYGSAEELEKLFDKDSGLRGVSGTTSDMRKLTEMKATQPKADLARRMFLYQLCKAITSMVVALGGLDMLVLTGGIGEHDALLRKEVLERLSFLGNFDLKIVPSLEDAQIATITAGFTCG